MRRSTVLVAAIAACAPAAPHYPLQPRFRSASGGPIEIRGAVEHPGPIPYAPGISLTCAMRLAGGPTAFGRDRAEVTRTERDQPVMFVVPIRSIVSGASPDLELAPGDVVVIDGIGD